MHVRSLRMAVLLVALSCLAPSEVDAAWIRVNWRACEVSSVHNCPLHEDDRLAHDTINELYVYVYDVSASNEVNAVACRQSYDTSFVSCGVEDSTSVAGTPGYATLSPGLDAWSAYWGTAYIWVDRGLGAVTGYYAEN
jgi:hypothetical protein